MTSFSPLITVASVYIFALISPGPNFFIISQLSLSGKRRLGILVALGMITGSIVWAVMAMIGLAAVFSRFEWLYTSVKIVGALYLIWFGIKLLRGIYKRHSPSASPSAVLPPRAAFRMGLLTSFTNPKAGAFWISVFASAFPSDAPIELLAATLLMIIGLSASYHFGIVFLFSSKRVQARYEHLRWLIDALCGVLVLAIGIHLLGIW